mgnify:CR=1 FL=1
MNIKTERLLLIPCTREYIRKNENAGYEFGPHVEYYLENLQQDNTQYGWGVWFVELKEDGTTIGDVGFKGKPTEEGTVEIGYGISPNVQNKGYATESVDALIQWAFSTEAVTRIIAECLEDNTPSIKVLKKLGMELVGKDGMMLKWEMSRGDKQLGA